MSDKASQLATTFLDWAYRLAIKTDVPIEEIADALGISIAQLKRRRPGDARFTLQQVEAVAALLNIGEPETLLASKLRRRGKKRGGFSSVDGLLLDQNLVPLESFDLTPKACRKIRKAIAGRAKISVGMFDFSLREIAEQYLYDAATAPHPSSLAIGNQQLAALSEKGEKASKLLDDIAAIIGSLTGAVDQQLWAALRHGNPPIDGFAGLERWLAELRSVSRAAAKVGSGGKSHRPTDTRVSPTIWGLASLFEKASGRAATIRNDDLGQTDAARFIHAFFDEVGLPAGYALAPHPQALRDYIEKRNTRAQFVS